MLEIIRQNERNGIPISLIFYKDPYIAIACEAECSATVSNLTQFENRNLTGLVIAYLGPKL